METRDRIGAVDENGSVVWGDYLLLIYAREILTRKPGATFIGEVKCSQVMYDEIEKLGGRPIMYKTGHSLIKAKMKEEQAELAGEMSGHMFFKDRYFGFDDAIYAACRLMEIVANSGQPLSAQTRSLPEMVTTPEIRVDTSDEVKFDLVTRVRNHFKRTHKVMDVDGARVLFERGLGLGARLKYPTGAGDAFRSPDSGITECLPSGGGISGRSDERADRRGGVLVSRSERLRPASQGLHDPAAAYANAYVHQGIQQVVQDRINHLFRNWLLARQSEAG